jgi:predicted double-glycine peptidase
MPRNGSLKKTNEPRAPGGPALFADVPHYRQTLGFTCGPASLLMAMRSFDPASSFDRVAELTLWKEATSIFMGKAHGGCGALGLALAAHRRGFEAQVHVSHRGVLLADRARLAERREVMRVLQDADLAAAAAAGIAVTYKALTVGGIEEKLRQGYLPLVLVSTAYVHGDRDPHWVVVTGFDEASLYINDPWVALDKGKTAADMTNRPIPRGEFDRMARYGKVKEKAAVCVRPRPR